MANSALVHLHNFSPEMSLNIHVEYDGTNEPAEINAAKIVGKEKVIWEIGQKVTEIHILSCGLAIHLVYMRQVRKEFCRLSCRLTIYLALSM